MTIERARTALTCGSCVSEIPVGAVVGIIHLVGGPRRLVRCAPCAASIAGVAVADLEPVEDTPIPPVLAAPRQPDFVSVGELQRRSESRLRALERWREQHPEARRRGRLVSRAAR